MATQNELNQIVTARIHPSIGFARVGDSKSGTFYAPEVPYPRSKSVGYYRDKAGALKRQKARFRIYGYNELGQVVAELTAENANIEWDVHVANKKAAWYVFNYSMDIPQAVPVARRNENITGAARRELIIDPGNRKISGKSKSGKAAYSFDSGAFMGKKVYLGELRTDNRGRLIFLGGRGIAGSAHPGNFVTGVGNQDGWYDDIADGPVNAVVTLKQNLKSIPVETAWVVAAPVDFVPDLKGIVTLYDCIYDAFVQDSVLAFPDQISFFKDIYPILYRMSAYQWLNEGFNKAFGYRSPYPFQNEKYAARLADRGTLFEEMRRQIFRRFRPPTGREPVWDKWPWSYGDGIDLPPDIKSNQYFTVTATQYAILEKWVAGEFDNDWHQRKSFMHSELEDYPLGIQPQTLDRASLESALGGPFRPGMELTWPMRHISMYSSPFRVRIRTANNPEQDYGEVLTPKEAVSLGGPLYYNSPGDLTRWMSVPWQLDLAACRSAYFGQDPYLPTFWPTRAPNQVLTYNNYKIVVDTKRSREERLKAYHSREEWYRFLSGGTFTQMNQMVTEYVKQAYILKRAGVPKDPEFPPVMFVEEPIHPIRPVTDQQEDSSHFNYLHILNSYKKMHNR